MLLQKNAFTWTSRPIQFFSLIHTPDEELNWFLK